MKIKCLFGHKFGGWQKVATHLERRCLRCGKQEVVFPSWQSEVIESLFKLAGLLIIAKRKNLPLNAAGEWLRQIVYTPPEDSLYTGFLSGIYYVDGKQVSEEEFREDAIKRALKKAEELSESKQ